MVAGMQTTIIILLLLLLAVAIGAVLARTAVRALALAIARAECYAAWCAWKRAIGMPTSEEPWNPAPAAARAWARVEWYHSISAARRAHRAAGPLGRLMANAWRVGPRHGAIIGAR